MSRMSLSCCSRKRTGDVRRQNVDSPRKAICPKVLSTALFGCLGVFVFSNVTIGQETEQLTTYPAAEELKAEDSFTKQVLTKKFFAEGSATADLNGDGKKDIVYGPYWFEGPAFEQKHELYPVVEFAPNSYSKNFITFTHDLDGDGDQDVIRVGFPGEETAWYENPGAGDALTQHWSMHVMFDVTDNESPQLVDIVGDPSPELIFQTDGYFGFATANDDPKDKWTFHKVSEQIAGGRFTHGIGVGDVNGDGKQDLLTSGGWLEQPEDWNQLPWTYHKTQFCPAASQMYAYDFDGDGKNDILTAIHAHQWGVVWFRQITTDDGKIDFEPQWIVGRTPDDTDHHVVFTQPHAIELVDINGDGIKDVVTGRRHWAHNGHDPGGNDPAVLYWFETKRNQKSVSFTPHLVDTDSGVGTQVTVSDINMDKKPDILVGNKKGVAVFLQK